MNEYLNFDFGSALKELRKERGLKRREVFSGICSENTYGNIENNVTKNYDFRFMVSFCSRMGMSVDYLISKAACIELRGYQIQFLDMKLFLRLNELAEAKKILDYFEDNNLIEVLPTIDKQYILYAQAVLYSTRSDSCPDRIRKMLEDALLLTFNWHDKYQMRQRVVFNRCEVYIISALLNLCSSRPVYIDIANKMIDFMEARISEIYQPLLIVLHYALVKTHYEQHDFSRALAGCDAGLCASKRLNIHFYMAYFYMYKAATLAYYDKYNRDIRDCVDKALLMAKSVNNDGYYRSILEFLDKHRIIVSSEFIEEAEPEQA